MSLSDSLLQYRRYRAPTRHGEKFLDPPLTQAPATVAENIQRRRGWSLQLNGVELERITAEARDELRQLAAAYTRQYRDLPVDPATFSPGAPLIMSGHQPRLFHPGVWFKNFVLDRLAQKIQGVAINLIVDNDLGGAAAIRVPAGNVSEPRIEVVEYDRATAEIPLEERQLLDRAQFESFGQRVHRLMEPFIPEPLVAAWWPRVIEASRHEPNLGRCIAQARHQLEAEWGVNNLELPFSIACETRSFRRFVLHLFGELPRLHQVYNESLLEYRRVNRVRSRSHPVPKLEQVEGWLEAPLWVWTRQDPRRRRLFARHRAGNTELTDLGEQRWTIHGRHEDALDELARMAEQGVKIRPRALVTTMYARLLLCDLFVHGIGGGKYDQLTDAILQRWLGIEPPRFQVATLTAQLPIARPNVSLDDLHRVERTLRELTFNPDRHIDETDPAAALIAEKREWLAMDSPRGAGRPRHQALARINSALQEFVADRRVKLLSERVQLDELARHDRLLGSREFAFCLFPEKTLRYLLLDNA